MNILKKAILRIQCASSRKSPLFVLVKMNNRLKVYAPDGSHTHVHIRRLRVPYAAVRVHNAAQLSVARVLLWQ